MNMFPMITGFMSYGQQTIRATRYIGQSFITTLSHTNRLPITIHYPYEKSITPERFRGRIHFEFDKCIACEVCVRVCPIDLPLVDWRFKKDIKRKLINLGKKQDKIKHILYRNIRFDNLLLILPPLLVNQRVIFHILPKKKLEKP